MPAILQDDLPVSYDYNGALAKLTAQHENRELTREESQVQEMAESLLLQLRDIYIAATVEEVDGAVERFFDSLREVPVDEASLQRVQNNKGDLREVILAPMFSLAFANLGLAQHPRLLSMELTSRYGRMLAEHPETLSSCCPDYAGEFQHFFDVFDSAYPQWQQAQIAR